MYMIYCKWFGLILCVSWQINACCVFYTLCRYAGKMAYDLICFSLSFKILYFIQLWCTTKSFVLLNPLDIKIFWYWVNKHNYYNSLHNLFIFVDAREEVIYELYGNFLTCLVNKYCKCRVLKNRIECGELWYWYVSILIVITQFAGIKQMLLSKYGLFCSVKSCF